MKKNWYVICTKQKQEKKVTELLLKKGIEHFCPYTSSEKKVGTVSLVSYQPLFSTYVFVYVTKDELPYLLRIPNIINTAFWKAEPVVIQEAEINAIRYITENYASISLERTEVKMETEMDVVVKKSTGYQQDSMSIRHQGLSISLPSLGYTVIARHSRSNGNLLPQKFVLIDKLPSRLQSFFMFGL